MNREDIIKLANKAYGIDKENKPFHPSALLHLEIFANLVASAAQAKEREACADMVYRYISQTVNMEARGCLASVAYDIRARGQA